MGIGLGLGLKLTNLLIESVSFSTLLTMCLRLSSSIGQNVRLPREERQHALSIAIHLTRELLLLAAAESRSHTSAHKSPLPAPPSPLPALPSPLPAPPPPSLRCSSATKSAVSSSACGWSRRSWLQRPRRITARIAAGVSVTSSASLDR